MVAKKCIYFVVIVVCWCFAIANGRPDKLFRKHYKYLDATQSFYKIHTLQKTWFDAKAICELEGASLFYPYDEDEALAVIGYWNETQPLLSGVHVGISAFTVKEVFETVDGRPIEDVYERWGSGEPNNYGGEEDCVFMSLTGTLNDDGCLKKRPFICKKTEASLRWNEHCDIPDLEYKYYEKTGRCYKFHLTPKNWTDAYRTCIMEQSGLAIINSDEEANILVELTNQAPKDSVEGDYLRGAVHLGFKNQGMDLRTCGYAKWGKGQPDGQENERCGSMFYNGLLNDINCGVKCFFICEHEIRILKTALDFKFGEDF